MLKNWLKRKIEDRKIIRVSAQISLPEVLQKNTKKKVYEFLLPDALLPSLAYWIGHSPILHIKKECLVNPGAYCCASHSHPFILALAEGRSALAQFYERFCPQDVCEMYAIEKQGLTGEDLPPWEVPWLLKKRSQPSPEGGLKPKDGVSYYGPVSESKLNLELSRLIAVKQSVSQYGYVPALDKHIEGYFLQNNDDLRFYILGGKHRAAVLSHLGYARIPVRIRGSSPKVVHRCDVENWPLVKSGLMDKQLALKIFDCHFK